MDLCLQSYNGLNVMLVEQKAADREIMAAAAVCSA